MSGPSQDNRTSRRHWSRRRKIVVILIALVMVATTSVVAIAEQYHSTTKETQLATAQNIVPNSGYDSKACDGVTSCSNTIAVAKWSVLLVGEAENEQGTSGLAVAVHGYTTTALEVPSTSATYPSESIYGVLITSAATVTVYVNFTGSEYYVIDLADFENTVVTSTYSSGTGTSDGDSEAVTCASSPTIANEVIFTEVAGKSTTLSSMNPGQGSQLSGPTATTSTIVNGEDQYYTDPNTGSYSTTNTLSNTVDWRSACVGLEPTTAPTAPTGLSASSIGTQSLTLSWSVTSSQSAYLTGGEVYEAAYTTACNAYSAVVSASSPYTSASVTSLTEGDFYCFEVTVSNGTGASTYSAAITDIQTETSPGAPTGLAITAQPMSTTVLNLGWTNSSTGNPVQLVNDTIARWSGSSCSGTATYTNLADADTTAIQVTGLTAYTTYSFELAQWNSIGIGSWTACSSGTTYGTPSAPTSLSVSAETAATITIDWSNSNSAGIILNDTVEYGTTTHVYTNWLSVGDVGTYTVPNLNPDTEYYFTVVAWTGGAASTNSSQLGVLTLAGIPSPPTNLQVTAKTATSLSLSWTAPSAGLGPIVNFTGLYEVSTCGATSGNSIGTWVYSVSVGTGTTVTISGLSPSTTYCVGVAAWTQGGQGAQVTTFATTYNAAPVAPTGVTYQTASRVAITLNWTLVTQSTDVNVTVYYTTASGCSGALTAESVGVATSYTTTGLTAATVYYWEVTAWSNGGQSGKSACILGATQASTPPMPYNVAALAVYQTSATIIWTNPAGYSLTANVVYLSSANGSCGSWGSGYPKTIAVSAYVTLTSLSPNSNYCVQVQAIDTGSPLSLPFSFTTGQLVTGVGPSPTGPTAYGGLVLAVALLGAVATAVATASYFRGTRRRPR